MKKIIRLENLDCANCAAKLERAIAKVDGVISANINFMAMKLTLEVDDFRAEEVFSAIKKTATKVEPECNLLGL